MKVRKVAVVGAGLMGYALAAVHALGGLEVRLFDNNPEQLQKSKPRIAQVLDTLVESASISSLEAQTALARITYVQDLESALENADLIIEAVTERPEIKTSVFTDIDRLASPDAIIASNTSYLDIFALVPAARQQNTLIAHWYTPPYIIDLVDVVPGPATDPSVIEFMASLYRGMGKFPLVFKKFIPGYIANRLQSAVNLEAFYLLENTDVTHTDIDDSIRHGLALRLCLMGQMKKADFTGLEMVRNALASRAYQPPAATGRSKVVDDLISQGRKGVLSGAGFYDYGDTPAERLIRNRDKELLALKRALVDIKKDSV